MPYHLEKDKNNRWFVLDNSGVKLPSKKGFKTKKEARAQEIAVALSESKRNKRPISYYLKSKPKSKSKSKK